jgi:hypothetical protein
MKISTTIYMFCVGLVFRLEGKVGEEREERQKENRTEGKQGGKEKDIFQSKNLAG